MSAKSIVIKEVINRMSYMSYYERRDFIIDKGRGQSGAEDQ